MSPIAWCRRQQRLSFVAIGGSGARREGGGAPSKVNAASISAGASTRSAFVIEALEEVPNIVGGEAQAQTALVMSACARPSYSATAGAYGSCSSSRSRPSSGKDPRCPQARGNFQNSAADERRGLSRGATE